MIWEVDVLKRAQIHSLSILNRNQMLEVSQEGIASLWRQKSSKCPA